MVILVWMVRSGHVYHSAYFFHLADKKSLHYVSKLIIVRWLFIECSTVSEYSQHVGYEKSTAGVVA